MGRLEGNRNSIMMRCVFKTEFRNEVGQHVDTSSVSVTVFLAK